MSVIIRTERYRRGVIGWLFAGLYGAFNLVMAGWMIVSVIEASNAQLRRADGLSLPITPFSGIGLEIAPAAKLLLVLLVWALGTIVLGALLHFTRGSKVVVEEQEE